MWLLIVLDTPLVDPEAATLYKLETRHVILVIITTQVHCLVSTHRMNHTHNIYDYKAGSNCGQVSA